MKFTSRNVIAIWLRVTILKQRIRLYMTVACCSQLVTDAGSKLKLVTGASRGRNILCEVMHLHF